MAEENSVPVYVIGRESDEDIPEMTRESVHSLGGDGDKLGVFVHKQHYGIGDEVIGSGSR